MGCGSWGAGHVVPVMWCQSCGASHVVPVPVMWCQSCGASHVVPVMCVLCLHQKGYCGMYAKPKTTAKRLPDRARMCLSNDAGA